MENKATLIERSRQFLRDDALVEVVIWRVPTPVPGSAHRYKYRLALVVSEVCVLRYDNEAGKGDHKHVGTLEVAYGFTDPAQLVSDFWADVDAHLGG
jgi:hypothetical protein